MKKFIFILTCCLALAIVLFFFFDYIPFAKGLNWKAYDLLSKAELKLVPPPLAINDILLVTVDNETLQQIPARWPYPRDYFSKVIENLQGAKPAAIAFDFVFLGSSPGQDSLLKDALALENNVILPVSVNEKGLLDISTISYLGKEASSGIITKLQDFDEVARRSLTYLVGEKNPDKAYLSWEMQILKSLKGADLKNFRDRGNLVTMGKSSAEEWKIPVEPDTKSYLIRFHGNTVNFPRLSFYKALSGEFKPASVRNKIVIVGLCSSLFQDIHLTPIGWLPGITLNANSFLSLYSRDFLKELPGPVNLLILIMGITLLAYAASFLNKTQAGLVVVLAIFIFVIFSFGLFEAGFVWNYFLFPFAALVCPALSAKAYSLLRGRANNT